MSVLIWATEPVLMLIWPLSPIRWIGLVVTATLAIASGICSREHIGGGGRVDG